MQTEVDQPERRRDLDDVRGVAKPDPLQPRHTSKASSFLEAAAPLCGGGALVTGLSGSGSSRDSPPSTLSMRACQAC
jgi:hypothetical protein